ncbi:hypothetical protein AAFF_G00023680 [Aldrovandia affinis]|uniref:Uncharacterized protein n=1 Tax=Aldrovandia affinis TaxID=143900 RepID=A0AAD7T5R5_9TELE|nr:hypothetical protein AAFF_G00023680 [Aldrovandia affinis]
MLVFKHTHTYILYTHRPTHTHKLTSVCHYFKYFNPSDTRKKSHRLKKKNIFSPIFRENFVFHMICMFYSVLCLVENSQGSTGVFSNFTGI